MEAGHPDQDGLEVQAEEAGAVVAEAEDSPVVAAALAAVDPVEAGNQN